VIGWLQGVWAEAAGEYAISTGKDLRDEPIHVIYTIGYALMRRFALREEEQVKALRKVDEQLRSLEDNVSNIPDWMAAFEVKPAG